VEGLDLAHIILRRAGSGGKYEGHMKAMKAKEKENGRQKEKTKAEE
jgi:hypothetical protein